MSVHNGRLDPVPGTLHACSIEGDVEVGPESGRVVRFGRGGKQERFRVDLRVGTYDRGVSRRHGELTYRLGHWWLRNTGRRSLRLPNNPPLPEELHGADTPIALDVGCTQVYVLGETKREHVVELYVFGDMPRKAPPPDAGTVPPKQWKLADDERVVLVAMGQRYLLHTSTQRPLTYRETALELESRQLERIWGARWAEKRQQLTADKFVERLEKKVQHTLTKVRDRLATEDFPYELHRTEAGGPSDDRLKRNLFRGLMESNTLAQSDLALLVDKPPDRSESAG